jgi:predicted DNA-binding WGR domain protein
MSEDIKKVSLHCQEGGSNKLYVIWIEPKDGGHVVLAQWGRMGSAMQSGSKTPTPVTLEKATAVMDKVIKEKLGKGYKYYGEDAPAYTHVEGAEDTGTRVMLLTAATEDDLEWLIKDDSWAAQEKLNGKRITISINGDVVTGANRKGLICPIPEAIAATLQNTVDTTVLDGELVRNVYYAFDIMVGTKNEDYMKLPMAERHGILTAFCGVLKLKPSVAIECVPHVTGEKNKRALVEKLRKGCREGVVFKKLDGQYVPGKIENIKKAIAIKVKFYAELSAIVGKWNEKNSISLLAIDGAKKVHIGNVTVHEKYKPQIVVGGVIRIKYLYATDAGILYQPNLDPDDNGKVMRDDQTESDCLKGQLKYEGKD